MQNFRLKGLEIGWWKKYLIVPVLIVMYLLVFRFYYQTDRCYLPIPHSFFEAGKQLSDHQQISKDAQFFCALKRYCINPPKPLEILLCGQKDQVIDYQ